MIPGARGVHHRGAPPFLPPQPHNQKWVGGGGEAGCGGRAGETDNADGDGQAGGQAGGLMRGLDSGTGNQMMSYPNNYSPMPAPKAYYYCTCLGPLRSLLTHISIQQSLIPALKRDHWSEDLSQNE